MGWTREQAIEFFRANAAKADQDIVVEVDRYIVWPGQALAYKMGQLKIRELRTRAEQQLGRASTSGSSTTSCSNKGRYAGRPRSPGRRVDRQIPTRGTELTISSLLAAAHSRDTSPAVLPAPA